MWHGSFAVGCGVAISELVSPQGRHLYHSFAMMQATQPLLSVLKKNQQIE
jgi:hypothetical protein